MGELWEISGSAFLVLYAVGVALGVAVVLAARWAARRPPKPDAPPRVDEFDLAFLAGGPDRMVRTAVAELVRTGRLRVNRAGRLSATTDEDPSHPLESLVLRHVGGGGTNAQAVVRACVASDAIRETSDRLTASGLLTSPAAAKRARWLAPLGLWAVVAVGAVRWNVDITEGAAVSFLPLLLVGSVVAAVALMRRPLLRLTAAGERVLDSVDDEGEFVRVALRGLSAVSDPEIRRLLAPPVGRAPAARSTYGTGACGTGASCGAHAAGCGSGGGGS
ncbi:TIGR04222 domain-containing membrane protein [Actinophytocola xanthii]|uniref:TIGR04222 domain-containing membrane protein n=1 Tax=Actinophytocola xanthii TaxID=1912961 RepID=A0A1Q8CMH0_9PSEU|nr:TIGR04222 domain-containing membrane protein [Actinophytocola xanthii]OLF15549.1 hypothetical protein BU204_21760 [Actinophytocola xanthii]